jgi:glycosyltransferase involved in cell wall biosynthesis
MNWRTQCAAIIPCVNEEATIGALVAAVRDQVETVLVVDDGSKDHTAAVARRAGAEVIRRECCGGKGAALQIGWQRAHNCAFPWALMLDGDGQHSPEDIPAFFHRAEATGAALIVGNRMVDAARMPWLRRHVNQWMSRRLSLASGRQLPDSQCGFRLMDLGAWTRVPLRTRHFEIESELLHGFIAAGQVVEFVPIRVIYKNEQSKICPLRDTVRWFHWWTTRIYSARELAVSAPRSGNSKVTFPSSSITSSAENGRPALEMNLLKRSV